jgi:SulP family sulfate permease
VIVLLLTFFLTVLVDLTVAVEVGLVAAAFLFMKRMSEVTNVSHLTREFAEETAADSPLYADVAGRKIPPGVQIYAIDGPFFFGAAEKFKETLGAVAGAPRALVLIMRQVSAIDSTGLHALKDMVGRFRAGGTAVIVVGLHAQPMVALERAGLLDLLGRESLVGTIDEALDRARALAAKG